MLMLLLVLGSSAIIKKETPSQLLEAAFTQLYVDESGDQLIPRSTDELVSYPEYYKMRYCQDSWSEEKELNSALERYCAPVILTGHT